ncbi:MAG: type II toxin-antitoxin system RelE/ParE family toxin [Candidatus Gracilibacteria bacterium]|nr:type II toxin-antitoxin system RelE/ParE family toxin [Candidatus Gracilibacteria bacterium]
MYKIIYKPLALKDINDIYNYIILDNIQVAIKVQETIFNFINYLALFPMLGKQNGNNHNLREIIEPAFKYRIIYKIENNTVFIVGIFKNKNLY